MANQRMSLKCVCGEERYLAKRFGRGYCIWVDDREGYLDKLEEFFELHAACGEGSFDHFTISYEHPPDSI